jgi:hypothetical protein
LQGTIVMLQEFHWSVLGVFEVVEEVRCVTNNPYKIETGRLAVHTFSEE